MSTNFIQLNPLANNQESDSAFASDSLVTGGVTVDAPLPSPYLNKWRYQASTFYRALSLALVAKGYSPNDGSAAPTTAVANLAAVFANILTFADKPVLFTSPAFTGIPTCPTATTGLHTTQLANTQFVFNSAMGAYATGMKLQAGSGVGGGPQTFPVAFSGSAVAVVGSSFNTTFGAASLTATGFTAQVASGATFWYIAIGPA
jgi:hypothetical protein